MMITPDAVLPAAYCGVFFVMLHFYTSQSETCGFRIWPRTRRDWLGYGFRTVEQVYAGTLLLGGASYLLDTGGCVEAANRVAAARGVGVAFGVSTFLLIVGTAVFWRREEKLAGSGMVFLTAPIFINIFFNLFFGRTLDW